MGCGRSKKLQITNPQDQHGAPGAMPHAVSPKGKRAAKQNKKLHKAQPQEVHVNVFQDSTNNNELRGSSYNNAKPRLRSAIRRSSNEANIKPVISHEDKRWGETICPTVLSDHLTTPVSDLPPNPDSGFDSYRPASEASDWAPRSSSKQDDSVLKSGRLSHSSCVSVRADSAMTSSVVTARDLNASFITVCDDFTGTANGDLTLGSDTPLQELSDFEDTPLRTLSNTPSETPLRTLSNTPSRSLKSVEPMPMTMLPKSIGVIREESEGGFTPRSITNYQDDFVSPRNGKEEQYKNHSSGDLPKHFPDEVLRHNQNVGWCEHGIYNGLVYDTSKFIKVLGPMYDEKIQIEKERKQAERLKKKKNRSFSDSDSDDYYDSDDDFFVKDNLVLTFDDVYPKRVMNPISSLGRGIKLLTSKDIDMNIIIQKLTECLIGEVKNYFSREFWDKFRKDVETVLEDLIRADLKDDLSLNVRDVLQQLQRWMEKYRFQDPTPPPHQTGDPNARGFVLPVEIGYHPEVLRQWVETWTPLDFTIPEGGAWWTYQIEDIDLGDPHEIFLASLRTHVDNDNPFEHAIDGEAAWVVMATDVIASDVMTDEQKRTEEMRNRRPDLNDPKRMERRRKKLLKYFIKKYEMDKSKVEHFLTWAQSMEDGHKRFQQLL